MPLTRDWVLIQKFGKLAAEAENDMRTSTHLYDDVAYARWGVFAAVYLAHMLDDESAVLNAQLDEVEFWATKLGHAGNARLDS